MPDVFPTIDPISTSAAVALDGTTYSNTGMAVISKGVTPASTPTLQQQYNRWLDNINNIIAEANQLRVVPVTSGALDIGVFPGDYTLGGTRKHFDGDTSTTLTDDATNYVYLNSSNALTVSTSSFDASVTDSFPLAEVVCASGDITSITDRRGYAKNVVATATSTSDTGTNETSFIIDADNAGAAVDTMVRFNRGSDDGEDGALVYDESANRFEFRTQHTTGTIAPINTTEVYISGTSALDSNGAAKVQSAVAGNGLTHSSGVLAVNTATANGTGVSSDVVTVAASDGIALDSNGVTVALKTTGGLAFFGSSPNKTLGLTTGEIWPTYFGDYAAASGGAGMFVLKAQLSGGSTVAIYSSNAPFAFRVIDAWSVAESADGGSWTVDDGSNDITDTVTVTGTDKTINRAGTIDDLYMDISASGSLRVVGDTANADCTVYIMCMRP